MNRDQLLELLDSFSAPVFQRDTANGGTAVISQRGARVLGLFPRNEGRCPNALWLNPSIGGILSGAVKDWEGAGEGSVGGDRLWISPERNFYYQAPERFEGWFAPLAMDPGNYQLADGGAQDVAYENRLDLKDLLRNTTYRNALLRRKLRIIDCPWDLGDSAGKKSKTMGYVGIESEELLEIPVQEGPDPFVCPWGLTQVQVPGGDLAGTVVVPTARKAHPIGYFGEIPKDRLRILDTGVCFKVDGEQIWKLGVAAEDLAAAGPLRIAYLMPILAASRDGGRGRRTEWLLLVRESECVARSSRDAVDPAKANPDGPRGVIQSYNNGPHGTPEYARFGEIEMQYLPVRKDESAGVWRSAVTSRLLAFQSEKAEILAIAQKILGMDLTSALF